MIAPGVPHGIDPTGLARAIGFLGGLFGDAEA